MKKFSLFKGAMQEALKQAQKAALQEEVPVGAVILFEGKIIARGRNTREGDHNPLGHAEIAAIRSAARRLKSWRLTDCTLVVTLEPCPMCLAAAQQARLSSVVYGAVDAKGGALSLGYRFHEEPRSNHRFAVILEEEAECGQVLKTFFARRRTQKKVSKARAP